ncbi:MAG: hypothetical protein ACRBB6_16380 [Neptuniibacter sp.]
MKRPYIIDLEASGFGPDSYPIEVGVAMEEGERYCCLICPDASWTHWSEEAEDCHQIPRSNLILHGKPMELVAEMLNMLLEGKTVYSDAWSWDKIWLNRLFSKTRIPMAFRVSPLEMIMNEEQVDIWAETFEQVQKDLGIVRHRASNDALLIQETYLRSQKRVQGAK